MAEHDYTLRNAEEKVAKYNQMGLHYNLVANKVYEKRLEEGTDPFGQSYMRYIIAGLVSFDMGRMMGTKKYDMESGCFAGRLSTKLDEIKLALKPLMDLSLGQIDLHNHEHEIITAHSNLSADGDGALNQDSREHFHVGTTKILHFLNPSLFIIVDSNAARAFRTAHDVKFRRSTQPGYSVDKYMECMAFAQEDILTFGLERFEALDQGTPITRIYDKLTFITGGDHE